MVTGRRRRHDLTARESVEFYRCRNAQVHLLHMDRTRIPTPALRPRSDRRLDRIASRQRIAALQPARRLRQIVHAISSKLRLTCFLDSCMQFCSDYIQTKSARARLATQ
jgi:hypothetical protein